MNVFLRSVVQAALTLALMYFLNWRLATLAFVAVPNVVLASQIFGSYMRELTKKVAMGSACHWVTLFFFFCGGHCSF